jgi:hypothetical protein
MAALPTEAFRDAVRAAHQQPAQESTRADVAARLDGSLRGRVEQTREQIRLLDGMTRRPPTGDPNSILTNFRGELDRLVEEWQQSILARPRATLPPTDDDFRAKALGRYDAPAEAASPDELARSLDDSLFGFFVDVGGLAFQLHLIVKALAGAPDPDLGEQARVVLADLVAAWKASVLSRPRSHSGRNTVARRAE